MDSFISKRIESGLTKNQSIKKEIQEAKEQVSNPQFPIVESFFTRDWLNRFFSLKGEEKLQKFLIRGISEEKLQELLEELNAGKGKLAVIVEKPPYQEYPDFPIIEGLSDYEMFDKGFSALSDEAYVQKVNYSSEEWFTYLSRTHKTPSLFFVLFSLQKRKQFLIDSFLLQAEIPCYHQIRELLCNH